MTKKISLFIILLLISTSIFFGVHLQAAPEVNTAAVAYLKTKSDNAWKTMALVAAGETGLTGDHLKNVTSDKAIDYCAPSLAITALGQDPRTYPSQDYVAKLKSFWDGSQLGDASTLNDDIFGLLALTSSGEPNSDPTIIGLKTSLATHQNVDGGWGFAVSGDSDTNMTSMTIMALLAAGITSADPTITKANAYLLSAQNDDGGFPWSPTSPWGTDSDASSDSWVISAIYALSQNPETWTKNDHNPVTHLKSLQTPTGYFEYQEGTGEDAFTPVTTAYAVIALAGKAYPVGKITYTPTKKFNLRIEGQNFTICRDQFTGPTALDLIKNAADTCNFTYEIETTQYGPYLKKINDEEASGVTGWLYLVNYLSPMVGAADYLLKDGDEVLWYYGDWGWPPLKIEVDQTEVLSSANIIASVQYHDGTSWQELENALVKTETTEFTTSAAGKATVSLPDGYYKLFAEKAAFVRSNKITVKFGEPTSQDINLHVNVIQEAGPGQGSEPGEISFSLDTENIDFGDLKPGQSASQKVTISNTGAVNIYLKSIVSGADVFQDNLKLDELPWENWSTNLGSGANKETAVGLNIPSSYSIYGEQTGALTFWAVGE